MTSAEALPAILASLPAHPLPALASSVDGLVAWLSILGSYAAHVLVRAYQAFRDVVDGVSAAIATVARAIGLDVEDSFVRAVAFASMALLLLAFRRWFVIALVAAVALQALRTLRAGY